MPFDEEDLDPHGECAAEIHKLRDALTIARRWMPDRPLVQSAWDDVAAVNAALGWAPPPTDGMRSANA